MKVAPYKDLVRWIKSKCMGSEAEENEDKRGQEAKRIFDYHVRELSKVRHELGETVDELFSREGQVDRDQIIGALELLCSWKRLHGAKLTETETMVSALRGLEAEVMNGGFHQYFFNSTGDLWPEHRRAMVAAGDTDGVNRFQKVLDVFPQGKPSVVRAERWEQLDALGEKEQFVIFNNSDSVFYRNPFPDWDKFWALLKTMRHEIQPLPWPNEPSPE
jgi:hypothetical protein